MRHNHQTHTYPADKGVPKEEARRRTSTGKQVLKKQHRKRSRRFLTRELDARVVE